MNLRSSVIKGVKWTTIATVTLAICGILKISILTRFLDKEDFGLMALVNFVLGFITLFMDMGITSAILHKQSIRKQEYSSLYWFNLIFSIFLFVLLNTISSWLASFYEEPELRNLVYLISFAIIISAFGRQFKTILQKEMHFKTVAIIDIISILMSLILAIFLAVADFGVYSLVFSALFQFMLSNMLFFLWGNRIQKLSFHFNFGETKPFLKIGIYQVGGQIINYFNRDIDILIIGKFFGAEILGGYSLAKQLVRKPLGIIDTIYLSVAMPVLPRFQNDTSALKNYFIKLIKGLSIVNSAIYGIFIIAAPLIINIFYGNEYLNIVPFFRILAIIVYFRSVSGLVGVLAITKGRTDVDFYWNLIILILLPIVILIGANYGIIEVIWAMAITQMALMIPLWFMFYKRLLAMSLMVYLKALFVPFLIVVVCYSFYSLMGNENVIVQIIFSLFLFLSLALYTIKTETTFKEYLNRKLKR
ncbi:MULTISPECIES: MOP flippase family protein [Flavobacteriaceae]|uniref:MOP flippase family protein n=1 Tax=Flavobacteriaceae TaxID=49546 RepID=UPI000C3E4BDA|nr:colanic acid exporter [Aequorivita sp.]